MRRWILLGSWLLMLSAGVGGVVDALTGANDDGTRAHYFATWAAAAVWGLLIWFGPNKPWSKFGPIAPFAVLPASGALAAVAAQRWYAIPVAGACIAIILVLGARSAQRSRLAAGHLSAYDPPHE